MKNRCKIESFDSYDGKKTITECCAMVITPDESVRTALLDADSTPAAIDRCSSSSLSCSFHPIDAQTDLDDLLMVDVAGIINYHS